MQWQLYLTQPPLKQHLVLKELSQPKGTRQLRRRYVMHQPHPLQRQTTSRQLWQTHQKLPPRQTSQMQLRLSHQPPPQQPQPLSPLPRRSKLPHRRPPLLSPTLCERATSRRT